MLGKIWPKNLSCLATWISLGNLTNLILFVGDGLKKIFVSPENTYQENKPFFFQRLKWMSIS